MWRRADPPHAPTITTLTAAARHLAAATRPGQRPARQSKIRLTAERPDPTRNPTCGMTAYSCGPMHGRRSGRRSSSRSNRCHTYAEVPASWCGCRSASAGVLAVALEGRPGLPLDEDEHLPGSDVAGRALPEPAQGQHAPSVPGDLTGRPARIGRVLLTVSDIEQVERVDLRLLIRHIPTLSQPIRPTSATPARRSQRLLSGKLVDRGDQLAYGCGAWPAWR